MKILTSLWICGALSYSAYAGPAAGGDRAYVIRHVDSARTIKLGGSFHKDSYNVFAGHLMEALAQRLDERGFVRVDSLSGACCKVAIELLDIVSSTQGLTGVLIEVKATVEISDAAGRQVYFNSYGGQTRSKAGGARAMIDRAGEGLADDVVKDAALMKVLSATTDAAGARAAALASVTVSSSPADADIEMNGAFTGNTPSTLKLQAGEYRIVVKKEGYKPWERRLKVASGATIAVNAELTAVETAPAPVAPPPATPPAAAPAPGAVQASQTEKKPVERAPAPKLALKIAPLGASWRDKVSVKRESLTSTMPAEMTAPPQGKRWLVLALRLTADKGFTEWIGTHGFAISDTAGRTYVPAAIRADKDFEASEGESYLKHDFAKGPEDIQLLYAVEADAIPAFLRFRDTPPIALAAPVPAGGRR